MMEKTFVDRVSNYPGRVKITPVSGQENVFDMERADAPAVVGTPMNKATFDSIVHSRLTGRYYTPTVAQTTLSGRTGVTVSPIPQSGWTLSNDYLSASTAGGYTITASSAYGSYYLNNAVDGNSSTYFSTNADTAHTFTVELPSAITVKKVKLKFQPSEYTYIPTTKVQGSNDGTSWADLLTITERPTTVTEYSLSYTGIYKYYRLNFDHGTGYTTRLQLYVFELSNYDVTSYRNEFTVSTGIPATWDAGQRIMIQTPTNTSSFAITSNMFNSKSINTILQPGKRYELIYTGYSFTAKEV